MISLSLLTIFALFVSFNDITAEDKTNKNAYANDTKQSMRIVGGTDVKDDEYKYPWFARATRINHSKWAGCGGSLVSPEYVLTAAHCVVGTPFDLQSGGYQIGSLCPEEEDNCNQAIEEWDILNIITHPSYLSTTRDNDFALVRLTGKSNIIPVIMDQGDFSPKYDVGTKLWAVGMGTESYNGIPSDVLKHTEMSYIPQEQCKNVYKVIGDSMMCAAGDGEVDSCQGDSGGPLFDRKNNVLVGIVSWGRRCAIKGYPGVYSRIGNQWDWVRSTICENHNPPHPHFCSSSPNPTPPKPTITCSTKHVLFQLALLPDKKPEEITWFLKKKKGNLYPTLAYGTGGAEPQLQYYERCIRKKRCYKFVMVDEGHDGLCCSNGYGYYQLFVDGVGIKYSQFIKNKQRKERKWFTTYN